MFKIVQNLFAKSAQPIGVDLGTDALRMAQVQKVDGEFHLTAAASADVPSHVRNSPPAKLAWFAETARDLLVSGRFKGRNAALSLPASMMFIQHLRLPKVDEATLKKTLPFEARGKLPVDPAHCMLRHIVAGDIFSETEPRMEVILLAAAREFVNQLLDSAAKAKLEVVGVNVEPSALVDCFGNVYRRKNDADMTSLFVDIGACGTRAVIARNSDILFARSIPIGGDAFTRAVATALSIGFEDSKLLRTQAAAASAEAPFERAADIEQGTLPVVQKLIEELNLCRRYHESTFANRPVDRLIFVGGEARQRWMCQHIARQMQLAAQIGDPTVRLPRTSEIAPETGLDRRQPQPGWAVALGLTMGRPVAGEMAAERPATERAPAVERPPVVERRAASVEEPIHVPNQPPQILRGAA